MKQGSRIVLAAVTAAALGATATAFAHGGDRAGGGAQDCPMRADADQAGKRHGEHRMGLARMAHRMGQGLSQGAVKPEADEPHKH